MENIKKKYLMIAAAILLTIILIVAGIFYYCCRFHKTIPLPVTTIPVETIPNDGYYHKKPIKLELMTEQEKLSFGISTSTSERAQVLERDASGKPTVYRLIFSNSDILKEY